MRRSTRTGLGLLGAALMLGTAGAAPAAAREPDGTVAAQPADGGSAVSAHPSRLQRIIGRYADRPSDPDRYAALKRQALRGLASLPASGGNGSTAPGAATAVVAHRNSTGLSHADNSPNNDGSPPDTTGAIGPTAYVEFVNSKVGVFSRGTLGRIATADLDTFVGESGDSVFDPQIQWDPIGQRWFYLADDIDPQGNDYLAFGYSRTADPSDLAGGWCRYRVNTDMHHGSGAYFDDYPKLGHSDARVVFGTNVYNADGDFATSHIWSYPKPAPGDITSCAPPTLSFTGTPGGPLRQEGGRKAFTPVPANQVSSNPNAYVVAADDASTPGTHSRITVWTVAPDGSVTRDPTVDVAPYTMPPSAPQPVTSTLNPLARLDTLDGRLTMAVGADDPTQDGSLAVWTQHTVAGGAGAEMRWYEIVPGASSPAQAGTIAKPSLFVFNGAISPASDGSHAAAFFNTSSSSKDVDIRARSRTPSMPAGTTGGEILLKRSPTGDNDFTCPPQGIPFTGRLACRWGDYSGASPDPSSQTVVWGSNQWNGPGLPVVDTQWWTQNFAVDTASP